MAYKREIMTRIHDEPPIVFVNPCSEPIKKINDPSNHKKLISLINDMKKKSHKNDDTLFSNVPKQYIENILELLRNNGLGSIGIFTTYVPLIDCIHIEKFIIHIWMDTKTVTSI